MQPEYSLTRVVFRDKDATRLMPVGIGTGEYLYDPDLRWRHLVHVEQRDLKTHGDLKIQCVAGEGAEPRLALDGTRADVEGLPDETLDNSFDLRAINTANQYSVEDGCAVVMTEVTGVGARSACSRVDRIIRARIVP